MPHPSVEEPRPTQNLSKGELDVRRGGSQVELTPDPIVELYKRDVDRSLLRENLRRTIDERLRMNAEFVAFSGALSAARLAAERPKDHVVIAEQ